MRTQAVFIERSTAEADRALKVGVERIEVIPPVFHEQKGQNGTVERSQTMAERIVAVGVNEEDLMALNGTKWTHFAFYKKGQWVEGIISALETTGDDRLSFQITYN